MNCEKCGESRVIEHFLLDEHGSETIRVIDCAQCAHRQGDPEEIDPCNCEYCLPECEQCGYVDCICSGN